jgi:methyl-accepting chemotaxis protein
MKKFSQLSLKVKLVTTIVSVMIFLFLMIFGYIGIRMKPVLAENIEKIADNNVAKYANLFKSYLSEDMMISRTIADNLESLLPYSGEMKLKRTKEVLQRVFKKHPGYRAVYCSWERKYLDPNWNKNYGRVRVSFYLPPKNDEDFSMVIYDTLNTLGDELNSSYYSLKINKKDVLVNPYKDSYFGVEETVTSVFTPLVKGNEFLGVSGLDIPMSRYADIISKAEKFYNSSIFLLSNDGVFVGNQVSELVGKSINTVTKNGNIDLIKKIKEGKAFSLFNVVDGADYYVTFYPFKVTGSDTPWMVGAAIPIDEINSLMRNNFIPLFIIGIFGLIVIVVVIVLFTKGITEPIEHITEMLKLMADGEIDTVNDIHIKREDEIGYIVNSTNKLVDNLKRTAEFAQEIGKGNLETEFSSVSEKDILGNSLLNMRQSLKKSKIDEQSRREEEEKQNWATVGFAKFGELLRNNTDNMETFTYNVISNLVKYTNSNQGALFLLNLEDERDPYLTMSSCYAYERKKYIDKRIEIGSNLVGQCYQEGETIYMTDIPEDYISITSGLGDANPNTLVIVPLKFNDKVYGVLELASFHPYEKYQIEFIEKLAESIASTISTVKVNLQTIHLLEESKLKSEELAAQEEEMRQNMEELQTTQEESARRELEMNGILDALDSSYIVLELNLDGSIISINENAKNLLGNSSNAVEGQNIRTLLKQDEIDEFEVMWNTILEGESTSRQRKIKRGGKEFIISESYTPVYNEMDEIYKILNIGVEIVEK